MNQETSMQPPINIDQLTMQALQMNGVDIAQSQQLQALMQFSGLKKSAGHNKFRPEDDLRLKQLVEQFGTNWRTVSEHMENRTARQCRDRWKNYLAPDVNNKPWTIEEDMLLDKKFEEFGPKWCQIVKSFPGRTCINIKNRYQSHKTKNALSGHNPTSSNVISQDLNTLGNEMIPHDQSGQ